MAQGGTRVVGPGCAEPLGVTPDAQGVNVAVFSSTATAIDFCLFDDQGRETAIRLPARTGDVFHGHVAGVVEGARYGLRAHGPFAPEAGHRFNPSKLLLDPYAVALDRPFVLHPSMFSVALNAVDSAPFMPKAIVNAPAPPAAAALLTVPWDRTVIYEAHVRGLTMGRADIPEAIRGTFAALGHPAVIAHLKAIGVTTLELLPAMAWADERHLPPLNLTNYWGYNPVAFCSPDPRLAPGGWSEVRAATSALAEAGIETILDVVFNHTGEGDALGPTLSLRGLDNAGFYRLHPDDPARYIDDAGTGNVLALDRPQGVRLAMDALRAWTRRGGMAGFRFDLATVLGRRADGFDPAAPLLSTIDQDPELRGLKRIAEPWDCGPGGYQAGSFPGAWSEWNDRYRDTARRFWRGSHLPLGELAARLAGSQDLFAAKGRPSASINFVTAHDGFTLADLVAYTAKRNAANGEHNRDGADHNLSWNNGAEGPTDDPAVRARRMADQRALLAMLFFSRGVPMLSMGAELGQSQGGNNNAYAQDNDTSWIDWAKAEPALTAFVGRLADVRRTHAALRSDRFLTGQAEDGPYPDVEWRTAQGDALQPRDWDDPAGATLQMILAAPSAAAGGLDRVAVLVHRGSQGIAIRLPEPRDGQAWRVQIDTANERRSDVLADRELDLAPRSVVLAVETPSARQPRGVDDDLLAQLAEKAGVSSEWWGLDGSHHPVSAASKRALLQAMDLPAVSNAQARESLWRLGEDSRRALPACLVRRIGEPITLPVPGPERWLTIQAENGEIGRHPAVDGGVRLPSLPLGRHRLRLGDMEGVLIIVPAQAFQPRPLDQARRFGLSAQLYALKRTGDQGVGDFTTLRLLAEGAAGQGAAVLALNPLHALFPADRERASPYYPSDRRFLDPLYIDLSAVPGADLPEAARALSALPAVDYPKVWSLKSKALESSFALFEQRAAADEIAGFEAFVAAGGEALSGFAAFQAIAETRPHAAWRAWPAPLRDPAGQGVAAFAAAHASRLRYHQYLQWLCERQFAGAAAGGLDLGLCRDLAVGAAPDGAEAWAAGDRLAAAASIGAPPDAFAPQGQVWGLPPPIPRRAMQEGHDSFAALLRANMRHAGALRIDHVLGLTRLFWVPQGAEGRDGAYVAYPLQDLLGVLALESVRARCLVIGEDLGTVADGLREGLQAAGVYSYRVLPFERDGAVLRPPSAYPAKALACVATHDLPPLAGWWDGVDLDERAALNLIQQGDLPGAKAARRAEKAALLDALAAAGLGQGWMDEGPFDADLAAAIHALVASSTSRLMLAQVEDLAGERVGVNLPGTDRERPNWRRKIDTPVDDVLTSALARTMIARIAQARGGLHVAAPGL